jgi:hypothetical protein
MSERSNEENAHVTVAGRTRKRAPEACTFCRRRKVRSFHTPHGDGRLNLPDQVQCREAGMCELQDTRGDVHL